MTKRNTCGNNLCLSKIRAIAKACEPEISSAIINVSEEKEEEDKQE